MGDSMAVGLSKPGFIECLDFWLIKLDNQKKFVTFMASNEVTSCLLEDVINTRMIVWCDLLGVKTFVTFIVNNVEMLETDLGSE